MATVTTQTKPPPQQEAAPKTARKHHRWFLWFFLAVQALFIAWMITGFVGNWGGMTTGNEASQFGAQVGTTIGAGLMFGLWVGVDVILGIGRLIVLTSRKNKAQGG